MARSARIKSMGEGTVHYHLMSRTNDRRFLFAKGAVKTELVAALKRAAEFSGIKIEAYAAMDNHFHVICEVTRGGEVVSEEEIVRRVAILKGARAAERLAERWRDLAASGFTATLEDELQRYRARMNDISEMIKTFKETFNVWYKRDRDYCGSIWSGRFASTLIEDGRYLAVCKRYVRLNPVRAGMVTQAKDYRWSWCENEGNNTIIEGSVPEKIIEGSVPENGLMKRVAQIGGGKIFGSEEFVRKWIYGLGDRIPSRSCAAHPVGEIAYSSHGWRLARVGQAA